MDTDEEKKFRIAQATNDANASKEFEQALIMTSHINPVTFNDDPQAKAIQDAFDRFSYSADKGNQNAAYWKAKFLAQGYGIEKDRKQAVSLMVENAVKRGHIESELAIIDSYLEAVKKLDDFENERGTIYCMWVMVENKAGNHDKTTIVEKRALYKLCKKWNKLPELQFELLSIMHRQLPIAQLLGEELHELAHFHNDRENYDAAFKCWEFAGVNKKYAPSQFQLGLCYQNAKGVDKELAVGHKWMVEAAENGQVDAQVHLGYVFKLGTSQVKRNDETALAWYEKAAAQGDDAAMEQAKLLKAYLQNQQKKKRKISAFFAPIPSKKTQQKSNKKSKKTPRQEEKSEALLAISHNYSEKAEEDSLAKRCPREQAVGLWYGGYQYATCPWKISCICGKCPSVFMSRLLSD